MFNIGNYSVWEVMAFSAIGSALTFALTSRSIGERAERYPGAAIIGALILQPWWAALTTGLVIHAFCAAAARSINRRPVSVQLKVALGLSVFALFAALQVGMGMDNEAVVAAVRKGEAVSWARIARGSEVGKFVADYYRPCVDSRETFLQYLGRRFTLATRDNDRVTCKATTVALAKPEGDDFAKAVAAMIDDVPNQLELSAEAGAEMDRMAKRWGI